MLIIAAISIPVRIVERNMSQFMGSYSSFHSMAGSESSYPKIQKPRIRYQCWTLL